MPSFRQETGLGPEHALIIIDKKIPICGGLGGGSTDGAAVLRALNRSIKRDLIKPVLKPWLQSWARCALLHSRGTVLEGRRQTDQADATAGEPVVICKPDFTSSTPDLFAALDRIKIKVRPDTDGLIDAINKGDLMGEWPDVCSMCLRMPLQKPENGYKRDKSRLLDLGALGACMSGSGSAVYGLLQRRAGKDGC